MTDQQPPSDEEENKLVKYWTDVEAQGEQKRKMGHQLQVEGAWEADLARHILRAASVIPRISSSDELGTLINYGVQLNIEQQRQLSGMQNYIDTSGTAYYTSGSVSVVQGVFSENRIYTLPLQDQQQIIHIRSDFDQFINQNIWQQRAFEEMKRFGFDQSRRGTEAITEFNSAWSSHAKREPSSTSALLPMRGAIEKTIDELFQRRPIHKDVAGPIKEKIVEIGKFAAKGSIPLTEFQKLQIEWYGDKLKNKKGLQDNLSNKASLGDREREHQLMIEATLFLSRLLSAVDPFKLKKRG